MAELGGGLPARDYYELLFFTFNSNHKSLNLGEIPKRTCKDNGVFCFCFFFISQNCLYREYL